jgi:hypothetical protein
MRCSHWERDVDYLLIAKPVAFNHLGIRLDCALLLAMPVAGSSLRRPRSLLLSATGRTASEICEIGEQGVSTVGFVRVSNASEGSSWLQLESSTHLTNSTIEKALGRVSFGFASMQAERRGAPLA